MIEIIAKDEPVCKNCAYYDNVCGIGAGCVNFQSPHFSEIMKPYEGCSWIRPERKEES